MEINTNGRGKDKNALKSHINGPGYYEYEMVYARCAQCGKQTEKLTTEHAIGRIFCGLECAKRFYPSWA